MLGLVVATAGIVAQVLAVEEPHLRRQHGPDYDDYASRTGRFLPRLARAGVLAGLAVRARALLSSNP